MYNNSSVCEKVFKFLLGGRSINNSTGEWKNLLKCQLESGTYSDTPFLVVTAALLQAVMPIAIGQQWSLFNRFKPNPNTKSVNADNTVRQTSRVSATSEDHNFVSWIMKFIAKSKIIIVPFYGTIVLLRDLTNIN